MSPQVDEQRERHEVLAPPRCRPSPELHVRKPIRHDRSGSWFLFDQAVHSTSLVARGQTR